MAFGDFLPVYRRKAFNAEEAVDLDALREKSRISNHEKCNNKRTRLS